MKPVSYTHLCRSGSEKLLEMGICKVHIQEPSRNNMGTFGIGTLSESAAQDHLSRMAFGTGKCSGSDIGKADGYHLLRDLPGIDRNRLHLFGFETAEPALCLPNMT